MNQVVSDNDATVCSAQSADAIRDAFRAHCQSGGSVRVEPFVDQVPVNQRAELLVQLLEIEIAYRHRDGHPATMAELGDRFPNEASVLHSRLAHLIGSVERSQSSTIAPTAAWKPNAVVDPRVRSGEKQIPGRLLGRYVLTGRIGCGSFGEVWQAHDPMLKRVVAIKTPRTGSGLAPLVRQQFLAEGQKAAQLDHPNIVSTYDTGEDDIGRCYIVSQYVTGGTLRQRIANGPMSIEEAVQSTGKLANALHYAHERGIVHRDVKPANVLLTNDGEPMLADFGLAKFEAADESILISGEFAGTPAYMSPEQAISGAHDTDLRTDIYSLGVMLREMLTGTRVSVGSSHKQVREHHLQKIPMTPPSIERDGLPEELDEIVARATSPDPNQRYATAAEFAVELETFRMWLNGTITVPENSAPEPVRTGFLSPVSMIGGFGLFVAATLIVAAMVMTPTEVVPAGIDGGVEVWLETVPAGARITFIPLQANTGFPMPENAINGTNVTEPIGTREFETTNGPISDRAAATRELADDAAKGANDSDVDQRAITTAHLLPGAYLVVGVWDDQSFHEVYRTVPEATSQSTGNPFRHSWWRRCKDGSCQLPAVELRASYLEQMADVARFGPANRYTVIGSGQSSEVMIPPFELNTSKINLNHYAVVFGRMKNGQMVVRDMDLPPWLRAEPELLARLRKTGEPLTCMSWNEAMQFAELVGKRLPDELELEYAAHVIGELSNDERSIHDLFAAPGEWTVNRATSTPAPLNPVQHQGPSVVMSLPDDRVYRMPTANGQTATDDPKLAIPRLQRLFLDRRDGSRKDVGVRLARSLKPRLKPDDFIRPVSTAIAEPESSPTPDSPTNAD